MKTTHAAWISAAATTLLLGLGEARGEHTPLHLKPPGPAAVEFAPGFPELKDSEWGFPLGGFGGIRPGARPNHVPVIFVHGNTEDACGWKLVREDFRAAGWDDQSLWALSYNGVGVERKPEHAPVRGELGCAQERHRLGNDGIPRITSNDVNVPDLYAFIMAVREYTGSTRFSIVSHSLGVTLARKTLKQHPELRRHLVAFVGIAGGNDGTILCPPGAELALVVCAEIGAGSRWLADLNGPGGADETWPPAQWMTVYDGSGRADIAYLGEGFAKSPQLKGAENREFPGIAHNDLRVNPHIVKVYREFLERAEGI